MGQGYMSHPKQSLFLVLMSSFFCVPARFLGIENLFTYRRSDRSACRKARRETTCPNLNICIVFCLNFCLRVRVEMKKEKSTKRVLCHVIWEISRPTKTPFISAFPNTPGFLFCFSLSFSPPFFFLFIFFCQTAGTKMLTATIAFMACRGYITTDTHKRGEDILT